MTSIDNYKLLKWLKSNNSSEQSLYNFLDEICDKIYFDLENEGLKIKIPYYKFKQ